MSYEFYLDIYFLENLVINDTVLRMIAILEKKNCPRIRRFLTAAGGSLVLCLGMMLGMYRVRVLTAIVCMAVETLMTTAAFSWSGWKTFMYRAVIFRLLSLLAEGSWQILRDYFHMPFPYSMAAGILLPFFTLIKIRKREEKEQLLYPVTLRFHGKEKKVQALWDSGNQLTQPVTGRPVHILELEALIPLLTVQENRELQTMMELQTVEQPSGIFSLVPYQSIGKKYGLLPVLQLDEIQVETEKEIISTPNVLVAVSRQRFSQNGSWQMILHQSLRQINR